MRPRLAILLVLGLLLAIAAGCGGGEEATPTPDNTVEGTVPADTGGGETDTSGGETDTSGGETDTSGGTDTAGDDDTSGNGEGDAAAGKEVFASTGCGSCHTLADAGAAGNVGPNLDESQPDAELVKDRVTNGSGPMPAFKDQLSEQQINDVAAYVSDVAGA